MVTEATGKGLGPLIMAHSESHGETRTNEAKSILVNKEVPETDGAGGSQESMFAMKMNYFP